jgi:hypothetical protein
MMSTDPNDLTIVCCICGQPIELVAGILLHKAELTKEEREQRGIGIHNARLLPERPGSGSVSTER